MQYRPELADPPPGFEWDPVEAAVNLEKHGITFIEASYVFKDAHRVDEDTTRPEHRETRRKVVGTVEDRPMTVVYTIRGDQIRIISARRTRPDEARAYRQSAIR
jgi:uncharacterized DUF497 family protein